MRRLLVTVAALAGWLATPGFAAAFTGSMPDFGQLVAQSELIVEGRVGATLLGGLAHEIEVTEIYKGQVVGDLVRIGPSVDPGGRGCETSLETNTHVIVAVADVNAHLNSLSTAVWYVGPDGSLSSPGGWWTMAADAADLRDMLRQAVPDTALAAREAPQSATQVGWILLTAGAGLATRQLLRGIQGRAGR